MERRQTQRFSGSFNAIVNGLDAAGREFEIDALLDNLSSGGLYMQTAVEICYGAKLTIAVNLPPKGSGARAACRGVVCRTEPRDGGRYGVAVKFTSYKLFPAAFPIAKPTSKRGEK